MNSTLRFPALSFAEVRSRYASGQTPAELLAEIDQRIKERGDDSTWIYRAPLSEWLASVPTNRMLPLYGMPFAVKDNIDVAGWPTSAACREFTYQATEDATVVRLLREAGAIPIGKTNLDQFSIGLTGTRSPFGICRNTYDRRYIAGGSSAGSAVSVAAGLVAFALGTDTAGASRVPASLNNLVAFKPTRGLLSTHGMVPACRSIDCVAMMAHAVADVDELIKVTAGYYPLEPYSRIAPPPKRDFPRSLRLGIPRPEQLKFFGDEEAERLYLRALEKMKGFGHTVVEIDYEPFAETGRLLYSGSWVAERLVPIEEFFQLNAAVIHPVTRQILGNAAKQTAVEAYRGFYELQRLKQLAATEWEGMDLLVLPTTPTTYQIDAVLADPIRLSSNLGYYTSFANLLDCSAMTVPAGFRNGLPFGISFIGRAFSEALLNRVGRQFLSEAAPVAASEVRIQIAIGGVHLTGQPLNYQLVERGGDLVRTCRSGPHYRLFSLPNTIPAKPGLVQDPGFSGEGVELEIWSLSRESFGDFVSQVPPPLTIGTVVLEDGSQCKGFLCEPCSTEGAAEITNFGGWRNYLEDIKVRSSN